MSSLRGVAAVLGGKKLTAAKLIKLIPLYFSYLPACFRQPFPLHAQHPPPPHDRGYHARARRGQHEEGVTEQAVSRSERSELAIGSEAVTDREAPA